MNAINKSGLLKKRVRLIMLVLVLVLSFGSLPVSAAKKVKEVEVHSKTELYTAITADDASTIFYESDSDSSLTISAVEGSENKKLIINAPKSKIINKAVFASITIISVDSYTESSSGNSLFIQNAGAKINIDTKASVKKITITSKSAEITINKNAAVTDLISKKKGASITVKLGSKADANISVAQKTKLKVTGLSDGTKENKDEQKEEKANYSIRNLATVSEGAYRKDFDKQISQELSQCVNPKENKLYYIDGTFLYSVNLSNGKKNTAYDFSTLTSLDYRETYHAKLEGATVRFNPYDEKVYLFLHYAVSISKITFIIDVKSSNIREVSTPGSYILLYFSDINKVIGSEHAYMGYSMIEYDMDSDTMTEGYVECPKQEIYTKQPFLCDDEFYWLARRTSTNERCAYIIHTLNIISPDRQKCGDVMLKEEKMKILYSNIYGDTPYILSDDFSLYKVNMKKLQQIYKDESQNNGSLLSSVNKETPYELVIEGSSIKQTAKASLKTITWFDLNKDGSVVVFDSYDKTYKIIEK